MAEPFSIATGALGALDICLRTVRTVSSTIAGFRNAPAELERLHESIDEIGSFLRLVQSIHRRYRNSGLLRENRNAFGIIENLVKTCTIDLQALQRLLSSPIKRSDSALTQLGKRSKTVYNAVEIDKISERISRTNTALSGAVASISSTNGPAIAESIFDLGAKLGFHQKQLQALVDNTNISAEKTNTLLQRVEDSVQSYSQETANVVKGQRHILQKQKKIDSTIRTSGAQTRESLRTLETSQRSLATKIEHSLSSHEQQHEKIAQTQILMEKNITSLFKDGMNDISIQFQKLAVDLVCSSHSNVSIIRGSAIEASSSLGTVYPYLQGYLKKCLKSTENLPINTDDVHWIEQEMKSLLSDVQTASARDLRLEVHSSQTLGVIDKTNMVMKTNNEHSSPQYVQMFKIHNTSFRKTNPRQLRRIKRIGLVKRVPLSLPMGNVAVDLICKPSEDESFNDITQVAALRVLFIPSLESPLQGFASSIIRSYRQDTTILPLPLMNVFNIVSYDTEVCNCIKTGNVSRIRQMLAEREISPNSRAPDGHTLISMSICWRQFDICRVLLDEGADPFDCTMNGSPALHLFIEVACMINFSLYTNEQVDAWLRLLLKHCGVSTSEKYDYTQLEPAGSIVSKVVYESIVNRLVTIPKTTAAYRERREMILRLLLQAGADAEDASSDGETPLSRSASTISDPNIMHMLLNAAAYPFTEDRFGKTILHHILISMSACGTHLLQQSSTNSFIDILARLLKLGCDPNKTYSSGFTPSDVALTPFAWAIWCAAIEKAGMSIHSILHVDDLRRGIFISDSELQERYNEILDNALGAAHIEVPLPATGNTATCVRCGGPATIWERRRRPFDYLGSLKVGMGHELIPNHGDGSACSNFLTPNSCQYPHSVWEWSYKGLSWRKHVAAMLWENGITPTPEAACEWAISESIRT